LATNNVVYKADQISFSYNPGQLAVDSVSLEIPQGSKVALLGANGSGKSTLLKLLDALYLPTSGSLSVFGTVLTQALLEDEAYAFALRRRVGFLFQDPDVQLFSPTVWDDIVFGPLHLGLPAAEVRERAQEAMALLGIEKLADRAPHRLSGGEKKKVALASVLAIRPDVLLLDEPTGSLDPRSQASLVDFLYKLNQEQNVTLVTATHDLGIVNEMADCIYVFGESHQLMAEGTPLDILNNHDLLVSANLIHSHIHRHPQQPVHAHEHVGVHVHSKPPEQAS
jgi:cobalt/nickel transport system ATP-binding protein